jgi:hypothetical protein
VRPLLLPFSLLPLVLPIFVLRCTAIFFTVLHAVPQAVERLYDSEEEPTPRASVLGTVRRMFGRGAPPRQLHPSGVLGRGRPLCSVFVLSRPSKGLLSCACSPRWFEGGLPGCGACVLLPLCLPACLHQPLSDGQPRPDPQGSS